MDNDDKCYLLMPVVNTIVEYESDEDRDADIRGFNGRNIPHQKLKSLDDVPKDGLYTLFTLAGENYVIALAQDKTDPDSLEKSAMEIEDSENF
jgi:hypothetical protein